VSWCQSVNDGRLTQLQRDLLWAIAERTRVRHAAAQFHISAYTLSLRWPDLPATVGLVLGIGFIGSMIYIERGIGRAMRSTVSLADPRCIDIVDGIIDSHTKLWHVHLDRIQNQWDDLRDRKELFN
jgi:hypothetical protein